MHDVILFVENVDHDIALQAIALLVPFKFGGFVNSGTYETPEMVKTLRGQVPSDLLPAVVKLAEVSESVVTIDVRD